MVDVDELAGRAVHEGWSSGRLAEELCALAPALDPARTLATLERSTGRERASLGPVGATRVAVRAALAAASQAA